MGSTPVCEINAVNHGVSSRGAAGDVWLAIGRVTGTEPADLFHLFHARFVLDVLLSHVLEIVVNGFQTCWVCCCVVLFGLVCCSCVYDGLLSTCSAFRSNCAQGPLDFIMSLFVVLCVVALMSCCSVSLFSVLQSSICLSAVASTCSSTDGAK